MESFSKCKQTCIYIYQVLPIYKREKRNERAFTSVRVEVSNENKIESDYQKETMKKGTHRICNLKKDWSMFEW